MLWKVVASGAALLAASGAVGHANQFDAITEILFVSAVASYTFQPGRYTVTRASDILLRISNSHHANVVVQTT
jgi:hypothetical protein